MSEPLSPAQVAEIRAKEYKPELEVWLCPVHQMLDDAGALKPLDNCVACLRAERDELKQSTAGPEKQPNEDVERWAEHMIEGLHAARVEVARDSLQQIKSALITERAMHSAWRKRAEEAELAVTAQAAEIERLKADASTLSDEVARLKAKLAEAERDSARRMWIGNGPPRFGDAIVNQYASMSNPRRTGYFVREGNRSGKLNPGRYFELTDGKGNFWMVPAPLRAAMQPAEQAKEQQNG